MRQTNDDENEPDTFSTIGWQAALITNKLRLKAQLTEQTPEQEPEGKPKPGAERETLDKREYVQRRLAEIASWEKKISGRKI